MATSTISSRRTSLLFRSVVIDMGDRLVATHYLVKYLRDPIEIRVGEPRVERQGERPLEDARGARKVALLAVGTEPLERIRADLRLDPLRAELLEDPVPVVDLDHVCLPAVNVAVVGAREQHGQLAQSLGVAAGDARPRGEQLVEAPDLREADGAEDVRQAVVEARRRHVR